ncbi:MAG: DUF748 domain-containing protein, partial [Candidatus Omnitrophica bacterium]|nr:DUF748 domain-containing protein [Candidatus Omnitrophota bacterium]
MKLRTKILFISCSALVIFFCLVYAFLVVGGKVFIIEQLQSLTQRKVTVGYFDITPPFNLDIRDLEIEGLARCDAVFISPSPWYLFLRKLAINEVRITRPRITYERLVPAAQPVSKEGAKNPNPVVSATSEILSTPDVFAAISHLAKSIKQQKEHNFIFKRVEIENGKIDFTDRTVGKNGINITVQDINAYMTNIYLPPRQVTSKFDFKGRVPWGNANEQEMGKIETSGQFNLYKKDITAKVNIRDIDGVYLYPYYSKWVDLEKARIEKAKLLFTSDIKGVNNSIVAPCHLELTDIIFKARTPQEQQEKEEKIAVHVIDVFKTLNQGKIVLDFTIKTKMSQPEFGFGNIRMAFEEKLAQGRGPGLTARSVVMLPGKIIEGAARGATDVSKAVFSGTYAVANLFKKAIVATVK